MLGTGEVNEIGFQFYGMIVVDHFLSLAAYQNAH